MALKGSAVAAAKSSLVEREGAKVVTGTDAMSKFVVVLQRFGFLAWMFPLPSLDEFGFVEKMGFFWIKHPGRHEHLFPMAKEVVVYMQDVSGKIHKGKDLFLSTTATEVWQDDPPPLSKFHFHVAKKVFSSKAPTVVMESFPLDVFVAQ